MSSETADLAEVDEPSIRLPRQIGEHWAIGLLGRGRLSSVLLAVQPPHEGRPARLTVLKRPRTGQAVHETRFVEMFMDESRLAQRIQHPNVAVIYDVGDDDAMPYIALEFVDGQSLSVVTSAARARGRKVPVGVALTVFDDVLAALEYAHDLKDFDGTPLGVIHRDVTPTNIFVGYEGATKLVDFGIAKSVMQREKTGVGMIKGKMPYLAPEQFQDAPVTRAADLWASGVALWELLAGKSLFDGKNDFETIQNVMQREVPRLSSLRDDVPAALDDVLARALSRDPAKRPDSAGALRKLLSDAAPGAGHEGVRAWMLEIFGAAREKNQRLLDGFLADRSHSIPAGGGFLRFTETGELESYSDPGEIPHTGDRVQPKPDSVRPRAASVASEAKVYLSESADKSPAVREVRGDDEDTESARPAWHWAVLFAALAMGAFGVWFLSTH